MKKFRAFRAKINRREDGWSIYELTSLLIDELGLVSGFSFNYLNTMRTCLRIFGQMWQCCFMSGSVTHALILKMILLIKQ